MDVVLRWVRSGSAAGDTGVSLAWAECRDAETPAGPLSMPADAVFALAPVPLMSLDPEGIVLDVNAAAANLLREPRTELVGRPFAALIGEATDDIPAPDRLVVSVEWSGPITLRRSDGSSITTEARTARRSDGLRVLALQDVSERVRTEGELRRSNEKYRRLSDHSRHVREEERARLSRDLHDRLGQALTGLKMDLAWLLALCDRFEPTTARSAIAVMMARIRARIIKATKISLMSALPPATMFAMASATPVPFIDTTPGAATFTAPVDGLYQITAYGASGGNGASGVGGLGAFHKQAGRFGFGQRRGAIRQFAHVQVPLTEVDVGNALKAGELVEAQI